MKRCPKCNRTFATQTQKFCTQDGTSLVDEVAAPPPELDLKETIRIDSARLAAMPDEDDDFETKPISREHFDPYKTTVNPPPDPYKTIVSKPQETVPPVPFDTSDLRAPAPPSTAELFGASLPPPIEPPQTSGPPPPQVTPPSRISIPTTTPPPAQMPAPQSAAVASQPARKSKLPLVLAILAVLFLTGIGAGGALYWFVARPMLEKKREVVDHPPTPAPTSTATTPEPKKNIVADVPPYSPPSDAVEFVNSSSKLDGKLKEHYVDFSFYYPESWQKDPKAGVSGATNFAKVERRLPPDFTQENFAVGWYASAGSEEGDRAAFPSLAENMSAQFEKGFTDYRKISEGPTKAGVYNGYEFRFESASHNTERGDIKIWGRVIFLPPVDGSKNGVTLLMLVTSLAPELKSANDVGVKGDLPMLLESFRFGSQNRER